MNWNQVRQAKRRDNGREYVWTLAKNGQDYMLNSVIGTVAQAEAFCEAEGLHAVAQYNLTIDDEDNPFIVHL